MTKRRDEEIPLSARLKARYARQTILPEVGNSGQAKLAATRVLVVGAGGLGCPAMLYLTTTGLGHLTIVDHDKVELSNLHRQVLFSEADIGKLKAQCAEQRLKLLGTSASITSVTEAFSESNALSLVSAHDIVLDCSDNFRTRYLVGDACALAQRPLISAAVSRFDAQIGIFSHKRGPCYRCAFPKPPEPGRFLNCADSGVLAPFVGLVGVKQALEAINLILSLSSLAGKIVFFNGLNRSQFEVTVEQQKGCPICFREHSHESMQLLKGWCAALPPSAACSADSYDDVELNWAEFDNRMGHNPAIALVDVRTKQEFASGCLPGALNFPSQELLDNGVTELAARGVGLQSEIICYCATGRRAVACVQFLRSAGFSNVSYVKLPESIVPALQNIKMT